MIIIISWPLLLILMIHKIITTIQNSKVYYASLIIFVDRYQEMGSLATYISSRTLENALENICAGLSVCVNVISHISIYLSVTSNSNHRCFDYCPCANETFSFSHQSCDCKFQLTRVSIYWTSSQIKIYKLSGFVTLLPSQGSVLGNQYKTNYFSRKVNFMSDKSLPNTPNGWK